ncbi:tRNA-dihydrouridine synthase B [bacteria symbiont BFo1 of Frankliniella occidentalis]|uniref:tRNA-dihydrouridine synthase B n=1 Tax=Erwinia aphidicola TaxID=68334 RepID=A0ABU8DG74_ERWAP|nr:tRNA dihydrouridine synthase DusB [Erwinia aphidicola]KMV72872.1 tRNA-dihydrouridine synthase B [bacteria symbiont BFo1 of Frankliniella occidentalis]PIJ55530.1 tRNA dihydrouridine synthase DusB [Erwinia sp. OLMDLW33]KYP86742.1 tRNA-dihydrouridine synthase B [bacteria symbiont BFo1 of Frankliniella occidentalis]KYP92335.1 tRNA-dihydrouridine synthase B [bacteria symbiont BFo1 of Frankliniella occidentalis]MBD1375981.1 tRNA dihydrouridine synthase DusB [Erwinia aphidicola]
MRIGNHQLRNRLIAAPMAGITDRPFRTLCYAMGAGMTVSEMMSSNPEVWSSDKSRLRMVHSDEPGIRTVQIAGCDPEEMAAAARINAASGAQVIDINMGCPAKKVNRKMAGSALLQHPELVQSILSAVVNAVDVPVTLKIRTGWDSDNRNCVEIAQLAERCGIQALTIHGRTRACLFNGEAEYDSIRTVKQNVSIPVIANGDITDPHKARAVLDYTGADALMIGRAAQGRPWIFREIQHYLDTGELLAPMPLAEVKRLLIGHLRELHDFYGHRKGYRIARKHVSWYLQEHAPNDQFRRTFNAIEDASEQLEALEAYFENLA